MPITIEYLAIFRQSDTFCDSAAGFIRLLQVDSKIRISGGDIWYEDQRACGFQLFDGEVPRKKQRYFHLRFTWDGDPDADSEALERLNSLLKTVRGAVRRAEGETETLWDDLSAHYARKAYPQIHEIESLMRQLIANFMLVTVGREWAIETLPKAVEDAVRNSKQKDYLNVLYTVDFIHLGEFLFTAYSKKTPQDMYAKLKDVKSEDDAKALQEFIPESNWKRYFGEFVTCEDGYLKARWERLYDLRCKVAHNALMTRSDLGDIEKLIGEVKPKLQEAIRKLSKVKVPAEDAEAVAESVARRVNATIGEFISDWQQLESAIERRAEAQGRPRRMQHSGEELVKLGILDRLMLDEYNKVRRLRNSIVHGPGSQIPLNTIEATLPILEELLVLVESGYIEYLLVLSEIDRYAAVDARIAETYHEIGDSDEFKSAIGEANANLFAVDEYDINDIGFPGYECVVALWFSASSEVAEANGINFDRIVGNCEAVIDSEGKVEYRDIHAEVDRGNAEEP
ncbi:HEPN domain-containing protein [Paludisphaera borealis]|uniref:Uncharacterized protein n=1 Tax=Paludisphaera borealis TaxID=1387353 RepID=A0A1U7CID7_9BACT|nr:HEPN domain-containing protein [Paludisphaera borealis]APW58668.1 hypothetical protein BSF38_00068 [Paludisphaera borealis]